MSKAAAARLNPNPHRFSPQEAAAAGRKGGRTLVERYGPQYFAALGRRGLTARYSKLPGGGVHFAHAVGRFTACALTAEPGLATTNVRADITCKQCQQAMREW